MIRCGGISRNRTMLRKSNDDDRQHEVISKPLGKFSGRRLSVSGIAIEGDGTPGVSKHCRTMIIDEGVPMKAKIATIGFSFVKALPCSRRCFPAARTRALTVASNDCEATMSHCRRRQLSDHWRRYLPYEATWTDINEQWRNELSRRTEL